VTCEHLIDQLLLLTKKNSASDLLVRPGDPVRLRINGNWVMLPDDKLPVPTRRIVIDMIGHLCRKLPVPPQIEEMRSLDFRYTLEGVAHFRIHAMSTARNYGIVARHIPQRIPTFAELGLPAVLNNISDQRNGLILVAGATGSGKSTTLASMLHRIIRQRSVHVVTLEDPIEFQYPAGCKGTVTQREIGTDVVDYEQGLNDALREAPDIILAGEIREKAVIQLALTAAETGHLVAATVHATTAIGTIQRMMGAFSLDEQNTFMERMAESLRAIIVQKLLPAKDGKGRIAALEVLVRTPVVKHFMLDWQNKAQEIPKALEEGSSLYGTQTFDQHLQILVDKGLVSFVDARAAATYQEDFDMRCGRN